MTDSKHPTVDELSDAIRKRKLKLGSGAQGDVYKIQVGDTQCFYAAKTAVDASNSKSIQMEGSILKFIKDKLGCNDYILCFTAVLEVENIYWLVTEYVKDSVELFDAIVKWESPNARVMENMVKGLKMIHDAGVAHLDIKPANILYNTRTNQIKYIDFGLSCMNPECVVIGTKEYNPPEIAEIKTLEQAKKSDMWSLGITIYQWINDRMPYEDIDPEQNWNTFCTSHWEKLLPINDGLTVGINLNKLINLDPDRRTLNCFLEPGARILRNPSFKPEEV